MTEAEGPHFSSKRPYFLSERPYSHGNVLIFHPSKSRSFGIHEAIIRSKRETSLYPGVIK